MLDEAKSSRDDVLYVEAKYDRTEAAIILVGEFDMTGTAPFWGAVSEVLGAGPVAVTIEARGLTFIDSSGLMALVRARDAATESGVEFRVSEPSPPLCRVAELCGLEGVLGLDG
jgi:anti-sigma B factor antagonist